MRWKRTPLEEVISEQTKLHEETNKTPVNIRGETPVNVSSQSQALEKVVGLLQKSIKEWQTKERNEDRKDNEQRFYTKDGKYGNIS